MTLKQEELIEALHDGLKAAEKCGNFCRSGAEVDEGRYRCWHNGTGRRDTDVQIVTSTPVLALNKDLLAGRLKGWIEGVHKGDRVDLNATMETRGPAMAGWPWIVGERGPEVWCATCPPDPATGAGHWHWTDGTCP